MRGTYGKAADEGKHLSCQDELKQQEPIKGYLELFRFCADCFLNVAVRCVALCPLFRRSFMKSQPKDHPS
jgi:hypothetical protein